MILCQFRAMFVKRFKYMCRKPITPVLQVIMPFVVTWFIIVMLEMNVYKKQPPLRFSLAQYGRSTVPCSVAPSDNSTEASALAKAYIRQFDSDIIKAMYFQKVDMRSYLIEMGKQDTHEYMYRTFVAAEFKMPDFQSYITVKAFYNFQAFHTSAISLALVDNAILQYYVGEDYSIETTNHPKQVDNIIDSSAKISVITKGLLIVLCVSLALPVTTASYTMFVVSERVLGSKHDQIVSGLPRSIYWAAMFIQDSVLYVMSASLIVVLFLAYDYKEFIAAESFPATVLVFLLFGWVDIPMMYVASFIFLSPGSALAWMSVFNLVSGEFENSVLFDLFSTKRHPITRNVKLLL